ncbi:DUF664 domain-containing protein, partial [Rathayibacter sp. AY1A3]|uniref:mycothiol transferase n=1 Tax=Rathayibacter sp. AY1A3 TaxID=2080521 RepID=UPI001C6757B5
HRILVHITAETHRHAGHADIVRELIDGRAGWSRASRLSRPSGSLRSDPRRLRCRPRRPGSRRARGPCRSRRSPRSPRSP